MHRAGFPACIFRYFRHLHATLPTSTQLRIALGPPRPRLMLFYGRNNDGVSQSFYWLLRVCFGRSLISVIYLQFCSKIIRFFLGIIGSALHFTSPIHMSSFRVAINRRWRDFTRIFVHGQYYSLRAAQVFLHSYFSFYHLHVFLIGSILSFARICDRLRADIRPFYPPDLGYFTDEMSTPCHFNISGREFADQPSHRAIFYCNYE